jgi:para-nitrobenzyl esterase
MLLLFAASMLTSANAADLVQVDSGMLEGMAAADPSIRLFKGVPYAQPPVGELRWKEPQPLKAWEGVRKATEWGNRCAQGQMFSDIYSRETGSSEDCLYLHIWTPAKSSKAKKIPVYVWFHGGGFAVGSGGEGRYDGEYLARQGIVVVNVNHRLGIFGFFSHPELTKESPNKASGNYGLLDQAAALQWVKKNIGAFGGDPNNVTIGGESAGSISVCGLMASPLSKDLFQKAIGESGSFLTAQGASSNLKPLAETELAGVNFAESIGAKSLADLRAMSAENLLAAVGKSRGMSFWPNIDGYFFPSSPNEIYAKGQQAHVPLLAGWNSSEMGMMAKMQKPTAATFPDTLRQQFKEKTDLAIKLYPASTDEEAMQSAADLASDSFIVFVTWKWIEEHLRTGKAPIYRFLFSRFTPPADGSRSFGAAHASEIPYAFNTLDLYKDAGRAPEDRQTARTMSAYWASFIKSANPNGKGLPHWPEFGGTRQVMNIDVISKAEPEKHRDRYEFADSLNNKYNIK